ncbi:hypothetical protein L3Q82_006566 [Scortum barcoo]|uniref:Uncharacterized protein n=1 Tax=Scortum barcoo TaxID=214431 RepID=A0ACB8WZN9_9TELE|nr:hypothetical protein L3Q82_006566 [Scortum barcoo]
MEEYITASLRSGIIRPSSSPAGAGFFFVGKKDGTLRPCIDNSLLNQITVKNRYPLPLISSAFELLQQAKVFTKLDLRNAYHLVRIPNHISMDPAKVNAVTNWPPLTSKKKWNDKAEEAFNKLKQKFTTAPILTVPDPALQFVVEVDASNEGIGAVLSQRFPADNRIHPCAFLSRKLSAAERNYDVGNKELLAVKAALEEWRHWLEGAEQPFIVWTDHKNLEYLKSAKRLNSSSSKPGKASRQARMGLLQPLPVQSHNAHGHTLTLDFITGLPPSKGNTTVLDGGLIRFLQNGSFHSCLFPLPKLPSAKETAQVMINHVFRIHGLPTDIVSDRGPQFVSVFWKEFCRLLGATVSLSSGYHPESNGQTERMNQELETSLRCLVAQNQDNMEPTPDLDRVRVQHPSHISHGTLAFSCVVHGYQPPVFSACEQEVTVPSAHDLVRRSHKIWEAARDMLQKGQARMKAAADRGRRPAPA